ncbi:MAG: hypothetical protein ACRELS_07490 [Candidatus Rokuibacteriota bacterium]
MAPGRAGAVIVGLVAALGACAGAHVREGGVFRSASGYRVTVPGPEWKEAAAGRADLELRHATLRAGMLANAQCDPAVARRRLDVLGRQLLIGVRELRWVEHGETPVNGRAAAHALLEGRLDGGAPVRIEAYTLRDARCVYDLLLVAEPSAFDGARGDFLRFVNSFATD